MDDRLRVRTPTEFGHAIRRCRRALGLTQAELADRIGVGRRWVVDLERGKSSAQLGLVLRTVAALRREIELVEDDGGPSILDDILGDRGDR